MEDCKSIITPSSPNLIASGNNENESENHRNSQQKTKNFMSPTISASSKMISPMKRVLAEWKPTILDSKSELRKMGISKSNSRNSLSKIPLISSPKHDVLNCDENLNDEENSVLDSCTKPPYDPTILDSKSQLRKMGISNTNSRNSLSKNPLISSPKHDVLYCDENLNDEENSVLDSCTKPPYDPLTDYLSPRPKYLRYDPSRKRKLLIQRGKKLGSISPCGSVGCLSSSSSESSLRDEENEGIEHIDEQEIVEDDDDDDDGEIEEEIIEGRHWGLKSVFFKGLIVFFAWLFFTVYVSSMNAPTNYSVSSISGSKIGYVTFDNVTLRVVSLLNVDTGRWVDNFGVDKIETPAQIVPNSEENQVSQEENVEFDLDHEEDTRTLDDVYNMINMNADFYQLDGFKDENEDIPMIVERQNENGELEILISGLKSEFGMKEIVAPIIAHVQKVESQEEKLVNFDEKMNDVVPESSSIFAHEVEIVAEGSSDETEQRIKGDYVNETTDSVSSEFKEVPSQNLAEVPYVEYDHNVVIQEEKLVDSEEKMNVRPNGDFENEVVVGAEGSSNDIGQKIEGGYDHKKAASVAQFKEVPPHNVVGENFVEVGLFEHNRILLGVASVLIWVGIIVFTCWHKCKKAFTKTNTTRRRINPRVERSQSKSNVGLPLTVDERLDQVHQESDSQVMNTNLSSALAGEGTSRRLPGVKQLGELEFTGGFSRPVKSTGLRSGNLQQEESVFAVSDNRKAKKSKGSHTPPPESPSLSSKFSERMTTMQVDGTGEASAVRRSERIRNRGITSP